jgi:hypothetical protein
MGTGCGSRLNKNEVTRVVACLHKPAIISVFKQDFALLLGIYHAPRCKNRCRQAVHKRLIELAMLHLLLMLCLLCIALSTLASPVAGQMVRELDISLCYTQFVL